jgi:hypothetical protein
MVFFIPSNTFLGVIKLYVFRKRILGTLGDALIWQKKDLKNPNVVVGRQDNSLRPV